MIDRTRAPFQRIVFLVGVGLALVVSLALSIVSWRAEHRLIHDWGFPLDDAWIHLTIARNLATGHGWSYNPGVPVQNSSGPLWTALVALGFTMFGPQVWVVKILGFLCLAGCVVMAARLAQLLTLDAWVAAAAALLTASGSLLWHGLSGMETPLAALLVVASVDSFYRWESGKRRFLWALLAAFAVTARPETMLLVPLLAAERAWHTWRAGRAATPPASADPRRLGREALLEFGVAATVLVPYFALNVSLSGSIFPTTFAAKAHGTGLVNAIQHHDWREAIVSLSLDPYVWTVHALSFFARDNVALTLAAAIGAWSLTRGPRRAIAPAAILCLLPAARGIAAPHGLPLAYNGRYIGCLLPLWFACAGAGLTALVRARPPWWPAVRGIRIAIAAVAIVSFVALARFEHRMPDLGTGFWRSMGMLLPGGHPDATSNLYPLYERVGLFTAAVGAVVLLALGWMPHRALVGFGSALALTAVAIQIDSVRRTPAWYARNVRSIHEMDVELGKWLKVQVKPGEPIAVNDIGAIGFFSERPLIDAVGLATPELTPFMTETRIRTLIAMRRLHPRFCVFYPSWVPTWTSRPSLLVPIIQHSVKDPTYLGQKTAIVYRADWDRFERYYSDALLERLDPPDPPATLRDRWRRGLTNMWLPTRSSLFVQAGNHAQAVGDLTAAEANYRKALGLDSNWRDAWDGLLKIRVAQRDASGYAQVLQDMLRSVHPIDSEVLERYANWQYSTGQVEAAGKTFEDALALHPDSIGLLAKLEDYWGRRGDPTRAEVYRERRMELTPRQPALR